LVLIKESTPDIINRITTNNLIVYQSFPV